MSIRRRPDPARGWILRHSLLFPWAWNQRPARRQPAAPDRATSSAASRRHTSGTVLIHGFGRPRPAGQVEGLLDGL